MKNLDLTTIRPYGDTLNDGVVQFSFTLPVKRSNRAKEAAIIYLNKIGFKNVYITTMEDAGGDFTFFVAYAKHDVTINFEEIEAPEVEVKTRSMKEVDKLIQKHFKRALRVVGACTGSDAHSVGIDAIMNMKGYSGDYGLERYRYIDAYNLGAQVKNFDLIQFAKKVKADAILISQVVTQKNVHIQNGKDFIEKAKEADIFEDGPFLILGGPRVDHKLALSLGFHAGFGPGTKPSMVANYILEESAKKENITL